MRVLPWNLISLLLVVAAFLGNSGCSISEASSQGPTKERDIQDKPRGPSVVLSVNLTSDSVSKAGAPLLIEAVLNTASGRDASKPITLSSSAGGWGSLLTLEIEGKTGGPIAGINPRPLFVTQPTIVLNGATLGNMVWIIDASSASKLEPGEYSMRAVLNTEASGSSWKGKTTSGASILTIKPGTATLSQDEARLVALTEVRIHGLLGRVDDALSACDRYLAANPKDGLLMEERADTLAKAKRFKEAVAAYDAALENVAPQEESPYREPPFGLIEKRDLAAAEAAKAGG